MGEPFEVVNAGCGGYVHHDIRPPTSCYAEPTAVGLRFYARGRTLWRGFACRKHAGLLIAPRALLPRDRDMLDRRRRQQATELDGRRWAGLREGPVARGTAAKELVVRAREWAARHP